MATVTKVIWGNSIDLASAKSILGNKDCYEYRNTAGMSVSQLNNSISKNDIVVGGTAAGVSGNVDTHGATRLAGWTAADTWNEIKSWDNAGCSTCKTVTTSSHSSHHETTHYPPQPQHAYKDFDKYIYFFGIDKINAKYMAPNNTCCMITPEIFIDEFNPEDYIQLEANYIASDVSSIEFYIVDGVMEIPILPVSDTMVSNERIFCGMDTRFAIDYESEVIIKKDGITTSLLFENAKQLNDALYTISYKPLNPYSYKPLNSSIKIKIIERLYEKNNNAPYVARLRVRKYGGNTLWQ